MKKLFISIAFGVIGFSIQGQTYCTPSYSTGCSFGDDIDDVNIGNFSDLATGCTSSFYNVQTSDTIFIQQTVPTSVSFTSSWSTQYFALWVDFNNDGDFSDIGEHLWSSPTNAWSSTVGSITIPSTVSLGSYRLRVRSNYSAIISASESCSNFNWGETHDYTITVTAPPACPAPVLTSVTATDTAATIVWTSNDSVFNVEYNIMGSSAVPTSITTYDTFAVISGLSPDTWYEFYLETDCSSAGNGNSTTVGPYFVKTLCTAFGTPFYEGFDNDSVGSSSSPNAPSCWYYIEESGAAGYGYIDNATWSISPLSNSNYYYLYNSFDSAYEALVSPAILGLDSGTKQMDIWLANIGWLAGNDVYIGTVSSPSDLSSLDIIDTLSVTNSGIWSKYTVYFDPTLGYNMSDDHIAIVSSISSTYSGVYIEDILIKDAPPCLPPSAIGVITVDMDSAQITYSGNGIATWLEYGPPGFKQGSGTQVQVYGSPSWLTGLDSNTTYDVYVLQMCSDSTMSPGYGPVSFKTLSCPQSQMCAFDLELTDIWGDGWNGAEIEIINSNGGVEYTLGADFISGFSHTESIDLCTGGSYTIVVSDEGSFPEEIGLKVISGGAVKVSYAANSSTSQGTQMASVIAACNPLCPNPTNLTYNAGKNDVSFTFDKNGGTGTYVYQWGPTGFLQATGTGFTPGIDSTTSNNFTITGLASSSCYDLLIIQDCGANGASDTLGPITFCTGMCDTTDLCDFTMSMFDTWGDGWNGASVDLYFNGAYGQTFGNNFISGDTLIVDFQICAGTEIAVVNGAQGSFPSEVYYTLSGSSGQSVSVSPGNFNSGPVDTLTANCVTPSCATPSNLGISNMGSTFADITWTGGNGTFVYHYTASGNTNAIMGTSTSSIASLIGLAPVTTYYFDVAEVCAPGDTSLKMYYSFTTDSCSNINVGNPNYSFNSIGSNFAVITFTWGGASGYTSYHIDFGDGSNAAGTGSTHNHSYTANGQYTAVLKLYGDCDTTSQQIFVNIQGIGLEEQAAQSILMYPNPTTGLIHISGTAEQGEEVQMRVMNYVGQELFNTTITTTNGTFEKDFDLSRFSSGTYLVEIRTATGMVQRPFVVRH